MGNNVAILGASNREDRYSNMAQKKLVDDGYKVFPINPSYEEIEGLKCYKGIGEITEDIDTLLIYMNPKLVKTILHDIVAKKPGRIIFNPGTEDTEIENSLKQEGIEIIEACSLVMLNTGRF